MSNANGKKHKKHFETNKCEDNLPRDQNFYMTRTLIISRDQLNLQDKGYLER